MKHLIIFSLLFAFIACYAQYTDNKQSKGQEMFLKVEEVMNEHYAILTKNETFEDPLSRNLFLFQTVNQYAPELLISTNEYKIDLLYLLNDSVNIKKQNLFNGDIIFILCNLCIEDYSDLILQAFQLYKENKISLQDFGDIIFQDTDVSVQVYKNYQNPLLIKTLNTVMQDIDSSIELQDKIVMDNIKLPLYQQINIQKIQRLIEQILSGNSWNGNENNSFDVSIKKLSQIQPPILNPKCD
jgi:hypothetical protein